MYEGASPYRGHSWSCPRCGLSLRSNGRPGEAGGFVTAGTPGGLVTSLHLADCDLTVVRSVLLS